MDKICPLMSHRAGYTIKQVCLKENCAWWVGREVNLKDDKESGCAIVRLAVKK